MTQTAMAGISELRAMMDGPVITPADAGFEDARRVWNAQIDRRPAVIARCASAGDVAAAISFARGHRLEVSVRGGAHDAAGTAVCDDGLMIDLSLLNAVTVDPAARRARAGGGALLADLDAAAQAHGLAVPAGTVSHTGVGGLTLGGGMGWLTRKFGLTIDNLISAEVVTADGRVLRAAADEHPDLFWAIRGGGGNFGVVTCFEFALHEVDPVVQFGLFFWGLDQGPQVLRLAREVIAALPPDVNAVVAALNAPPAPFVPQQYQLAAGYALLLTGFGSERGHARLVTKIRQDLPPLFDLVTPMPYVELQKLIDEANAWGFCSYDKGTYLADLSDEVINVITEHVPRKNSPMSKLLLFRLDGAYSRVGDEDTAFGGGRSPRYAAFILGFTPDSELLAAERSWVRGLWDGLRPHAIDGGNGYINSTSEHSGDGVRGSYGTAKYARLASIKADYDPDNVFHLNANIPPARPPLEAPMSNPDAPALAGVHHLKLPVTDLARSRDWYHSRLGYHVQIEFVEQGRLMGYGLSHPNGGPVLGLRLSPERARAAAGFDYFAIGVPDKDAIDQLAARLTALGEQHAGVHQATIGWILPHLHDPDGHEVRFYTIQQHTDLPPGQGTTITDPRESAQRRQRAGT